MKARVKFQKYGAMKFIGHLDIMRYFQKMFRRAGIDNEYTKGFSPHQIMSFAAPLGVGLTSEGEYVDIQLLSSEEPEVMIARMNEAMTEGIRVIGFHPLLDREENKKAVTAMSLVSSADYLVSLKDGYGIGDTIRTQADFQAAFERFLSEEKIVIGKKTKTSEKEVDIKPMITLAAFEESEYRNKLQHTLKNLNELNDINSDRLDKDGGSVTSSDDITPDCASVSSSIDRVADVYESGIKVYMQLDTGSTVNLKPELVMEAFFEYLDLPFEKFAWQVHRIEVYAREESSGKLIPLDHLER